MVTHFVADRTFTLPPVASFDELTAALDSQRDSANHYFAFRVEGTFPTMHVRAACKVPEWTPLAEATALQAEWNVEDLQGTLIGFWSPPYTAHFDVPGYHFHVVDEARRRGGHVLACATGALTVGVQRLEQLIVALPETADFLTANLSGDPTAALDVAERDHT
jgi:acetolactate decarboxylase